MMDEMPDQMLDELTCNQCGCTEDNPCIADGHNCSWDVISPRRLCSFCIEGERGGEGKYAMSARDHDEAVKWAREVLADPKTVIVDSETTGLYDAAFHGDWREWTGSYAWQRLPGGVHTALGDARATLRLLEDIAKALIPSGVPISCSEHGCARPADPKDLCGQDGDSGCGRPFCDHHLFTADEWRDLVMCRECCEGYFEMLHEPSID